MLKNNVEVNKLTVSVRTHIKIEDIKNLLDSASRGSTYWSSNDLAYESETQRAIDSEVTIYDTEDESGQKAYGLNLKKIKRGLTVMANTQRAFFLKFLEGDYDQTTGDIFLQCCIFGEVIYG